MEFIRVGYNATYVNAQFFNFFLVFATTINKNIIGFRGFFLRFIARMNGGPTKNPLYKSVFRMNVHDLAGCYLVIAATISNHVNQSVVANVIYVPRNFIGMALNDNFIRGFRIYNSYRSTVSIGNKFISIGF